ncbi:MAG: short chain dehydrogenase [Gemmatimonadetes bacterium]|nr:short chain dehydrogenase [Gemmatimonadota bacterium]
MRVVLIGATGTIGRAVDRALAARHEVVRVGHTGGDLQVDMASTDSIRRLFEAVGPFDALVSAAGQARFAALEALADDDFRFSLDNKLMGQVNLVRLGLAHVRDGGSFTLTSGVLAGEPMPGSAAISLVNAGVEAFGRAAALEMPRGVRINVVSPPWVSETLQAMGQDPSGGVPAEKVAAAYLASVEEERTGEVIDARTFA